MAGYNWNKGMSNNAVAAYESGEKPYSKWKKSEIIDGIVTMFPDIEPDLLSELKKLNVSDLKGVALYKNSWHHTSRFYNATDFYAIIDDIESIEDHLKELKQIRDTNATLKNIKGLINKNATYSDKYSVDWVLKKPATLKNKHGKDVVIYGLSYDPMHPNFGIDYLNQEKEKYDTFGLNLSDIYNKMKAITENYIGEKHMTKKFIVINLETAECQPLFNSRKEAKNWVEKNASEEDVIIMPMVDVEKNSSEMELYPNTESGSFDFVADYKEGLLNSDLVETPNVPVKVAFAVEENYTKIGRIIDDLENFILEEEKTMAKLTLDSGETIETEAEGTDDEIKKRFPVGQQVNVGKNGADRQAKIKSVQVTRNVGESYYAHPRKFKINESKTDWQYVGSDTLESKIEWLYTHNVNYNKKQYYAIDDLRDYLKGRIELSDEDIESLIWLLQHNNKNYRDDQETIINDLELKDFKKKVNEVKEETDNYKRKRVASPKSCKPNSFRTKQVNAKGDKVVLCKDKKSGKLKAQSILNKKPVTEMDMGDMGTDPIGKLGVVKAKGMPNPKRRRKVKRVNEE